jgi:hypothetical protein
MTKEEVRARIEELAIVPAVRASNAEDALFAAEAVSRGGLDGPSGSYSLPLPARICRAARALIFHSIFTPLRPGLNRQGWKLMNLIDLDSSP